MKDPPTLDTLVSENFSPIRIVRNSLSIISDNNPNILINLHISRPLTFNLNVFMKYFDIRNLWKRERLCLHHPESRTK